MTKENDAHVPGDGKANGGVTSRLFWEEKASEYTLPFNEEALARTNRIIGLLERRGLPMDGTRILDVGSGPGTFALPLALRGASVTALDISENMLKRLSGEAMRLGIAEVETIRASWKEFDPLRAGLSRAFDIVFSALSLAIETEEDILKMERCSKRWCVCIATGRIRRHALCEAALREFGLPLGPRPDIRSIREKLEEMGRAFSYESFPVVTEEKKTIPELAEDVAKRLEAQGRRPDRPRIAAVVSSLFRGREETGAIGCTRRGDKGVLVWRVDERIERGNTASAPGGAKY